MKKIIVLSFCFASLYAGAQTVKLDAGQKITAVTVTSIDMDMGMAGQMKMASSSTNEIAVLKSDAAGYTAATTITKLKMSQEGGGQDNTFDSEKPEDKNSEMGKALGESLGKADTVSIDKNTGKSVQLNKEVEKDDEEKNPMAGLFEGMSTKGAAASADAAFFVIPAGKKQGDKWTDSTVANGLKTVNAYELVSSANGTAIINVKSILSGTMSKEAQGMTMDITINNTSNTVVTADTKTSLVKSRTITGDMTGSIDVMGQSLPITSKMTSTITFQ